MVTTLEEALATGAPHEACASTSLLAGDKKLVGALDSACNRTVCGRLWYENYMSSLRASPAWEAVGDLVKSEPERETFKFGNDGTKPSFVRQCVPMVVGNTPVLVLVSVVEVNSLGLLLGRDFLEAVGGVLSFTRRAMRADHLDGKRIPLKQLVAGHFYLEVFPREAISIGTGRWTRQGLDGVLEVQLSSVEWSRRRAAALKPPQHGSRLHEQLLSEVPSSRAPLPAPSSMKNLSRRTFNSKPRLGHAADNGSRGKSAAEVHKNVPKGARAKPVALRWAAALVAAATLSSVCAATVRKHEVPCRLEEPGRGDGEERCLPAAALQDLRHERPVRRPHLAQGRGVPERPSGAEAGFPGGPVASRYAGRQGNQGCANSHSRPGPGQDETTGCRTTRQRGVAEGSPTAAGPKRWTSHLEVRLAALGDPLARRRGAHRDCREDQAKVEANAVRASGHPLRAPDRGSGTISFNPGGKCEPAPGTRVAPRRPGTSADRGADAASAGTHQGGAVGRDAHDAGQPRPKDGDYDDAGHAPHDDGGEPAVDDAAAATERWRGGPLAGQQHGLCVRQRRRAVIHPMRQQLKPGQKLLISQAWGKYTKDARLLKATNQDVHEAFSIADAQDYDNALVEPFVGVVGCWPFKSKAALTTSVEREAAQKGHTVTGESSFGRPYFLLLRWAGPSPLHNFGGLAARRDAEKKNLGAGAGILAEALRHRRSGRHFLIELARSFEPRALAEGQELLDEPGVRDFHWQGRRFLTSSSVLAEAFRGYPEEPEVPIERAVLAAMERQFEMEFPTSSEAHEGFAAETLEDGEEIEGPDGTDSEDERGEAWGPEGAEDTGGGATSRPKAPREHWPQKPLALGKGTHDRRGTRRGSASS